ncbi:hypothetical protein ACFO6Q_18030 [Dokdonella ginsengisoli]|uniref:Uncharacterized protein n=2 Tax=Dokdonella ginsengisoli TaxID=363846 RepID=A0ABV9QZL3_9GAMM
MNAELLLEAERRGILPPAQQDMLAEARRRGLIGAAPEEPGMLQQIGRQAGLAGRYAIEGAGNLLGIAADPIGQTIDYLAPRNHDLSSLVTGEAPRYQRTGESASQLADWIGLPKPEGSLEEGIGNASRALVGTGLMMGGGLAAGAPQMAAQPLSQAASTLTGSAAQEIAKARGATEGEQTLAALAGGLGPSVAAAAGGAALRGAVRGGEQSRQAMQSTIDAFQTAGTTPTVGQATEGRTAQALESLLARVPGSAGVMAKFAGKQADQIGDAVRANADGLAVNANPAAAGRAIERGIAGPGGFVERFKSQARDLYDRVDQFMPGDTQVPLRATQSFFARVSTPTKGAEATSALLANPKLSAIGNALDEDMKSALAAGGQSGQLPYEAVKQLRTRVGEMIANAGLVSDVPRGELKQLYGALSQDIRNQAARDPKAFAATNRAENYYRAGMDRLERVEAVVDRAGGPEKVFQAALSGTREGASTLHGVMQSLKPEEAKIVTSAVVRRLGSANPSAQNELGDAFSTESFLTNWNKLSGAAKQVLFDRMGPTFRNDLDQIAKATSNVRDGSMVFRNPAGTAGAATQATTAATAVTALLSGHYGAAAGIVAGVAAANLSARLMTNPTFVRWLARQTTVPVHALPSQVSVLANMAERGSDPDLTDAAQLFGNQGVQ